MAKGYSGNFHKNKKVIRLRNLEKNNGVYVCEYCGKRNLHTENKNCPDLATIDHFIPISKGGTHAQANLRLVCKGCNDIKGSAHFNIFRSIKLINGNKTLDERAEAI
jgi:5-methylcytosine-specific restriction endonuclease McrA